jgi:putative colanic acid biosynthesis acetyltransferase WcaF
MLEKPLLRQIAKLDLAQFPSPQIPGNRNVFWRVGWYLVSSLFFRSTILGLLPNGAKAKILRLFGARVGCGLVCKPRVNIKYPWFLSIGNHVWLGEDLWIDNLCEVSIGSNICLSQGVRILTGSHDWSVPEFPFFARPIKINDGVWVTAFCILRPGVTLTSNIVVLGDLSPSALRNPEAFKTDA